MILSILAQCVMPRPQKMGEMGNALNAGIVYAIIGAFFAAGFFSVTLIALHVFLIESGVAFFASLAIIGGFTLAGLIICLLLAASKARHVKEAALNVQAPATSLVSTAESMIDAFLNGWESSAKHTAPVHTQPQTDDHFVQPRAAVYPINSKE